MNNIKKIYQHAGKCDNQHNLKDIIDAAIVSTPEEVTRDSPSLPMTSTPLKKPSARKSMCLFANILDVKDKTAKLRIVAAQSKYRSMKLGTSLWTKKTKQKEHSKINYNIKRNMYAWITRHPQVFQ